MKNGILQKYNTICHSPDLEIERRILKRRTRRFQETNAVLLKEILPVNSGPDRGLQVEDFGFLVRINHMPRHGRSYKFEKLILFLWR